MGFKDFLDRLTGSTVESSVGDQERRTVPDSCDRLRECQDRQVVSIRGKIQSLTPRTVGGTPVLEAKLGDGTGILTLVWLGRRDIPGIQTGKEILVRGRILDSDGGLKLYNPWYQLV